jgi:hypothetical protein
VLAEDGDQVGRLLKVAGVAGIDVARLDGVPALSAQCEIGGQHKYRLRVRFKILIVLNQPSFTGRRRPAKLLAATPLADLLFGRVARDHFVKDRFFAGLLAQDAPEALDVLARRARAGEDDGDGGGGDVNALV